MSARREGDHGLADGEPRPGEPGRADGEPRPGEPARAAARATPTRAAVAALVRKDLRAELRTGDTLPAMALFSVSTFVLFHFGLDARSLEGDLAAGVFWVTMLFAAVLAINRQFVAEREEGGFDGFLLAPVDRTALLVAKALTLFCFLLALQVIAVPAFAILLLEPSPGPGLPELVGLLLLADAGIAALGTLVGALAVQTRAREVIVPLLVLPLMIPVVIAAARGTAPLWLEAGAEAVPGRWPLILGLYDLVFGLLAYAVFDYLLDE